LLNYSLKNVAFYILVAAVGRKTEFLLLLQIKKLYIGLTMTLTM